MIDTQQRCSLSQDLRRLVTGRMTNDDFDDVYFDGYEESRDAAVREIASFAYCLYSSALLIPYRLRGRHAVNQEIRKQAARAILFLRSGREYEWPPEPQFPIIGSLVGLALGLGLPLGVALGVIGLPVSYTEPPELGWGLTVAGVLIFGVSLWLMFRGHTLCEPKMAAYRASGDYDAWPFLRHADLDQAKEQGRSDAVIE